MGSIPISTTKKENMKNKITDALKGIGETVIELLRIIVELF
jgi:hypothetical protein